MRPLVLDHVGERWAWCIHAPWEYAGRWPWEFTRYEREKRELPGFLFEWGWFCPVFKLLRYRHPSQRIGLT